MSMSYGWGVCGYGCLVNDCNGVVRVVENMSIIVNQYELLLASVGSAGVVKEHCFAAAQQPNDSSQSPAQPTADVSKDTNLYM